MQVYKKISEETAVALGNFDGLHLGHRAIMGKLLEISRERKLSPYAFMFEDHPKNDVPRLMTNDQRIFCLASIGINSYTMDFEKIRDTSPEDFVRDILVDKMNAKAAFCGYNYTFGKGASGDIAELKRLCDKYEIELFVIDEIDFEGSAISSSRIRKEIENGEVQKANAMLYNAFSYRLKVVGGDKRGRLLGAPTINQFFKDGFVVPKFGVYASMALVDGYYHPAVTNIGLRPTIGKGDMRSETCILGYSGNLYGKKIEVALLKFLRSEVKFDTLDELSAQIADDAKKSREFFENTKKEKIKAVLFDFDDTLQDRDVAYNFYCNKFIERYFPNISEPEKKKRMYQMETLVFGGYRNRNEYFGELVELWDWKDSPSFEYLVNDYNNNFGKHVVLFSNSEKVLKILRDKGYKLGIISNGPSSLQNAKIDSSGFRELLDTVIVSGDFDIHKPDKRLFEIAAEKLGVQPCECVFVGDHPINDIQGANSAGMHSIWMNFGYFKDEIKDDITKIDNLDTLLEML